MDTRTLVRVVDELLWSLRREGFVVSTAQAVDTYRAIRAVGLENGFWVREALASVVVKSPSDRRRFDEAFQAFFDPPQAFPRSTLWERLASRFTELEVSTLRELLQQLASNGAYGMGSLRVLLEKGADLDRLLAAAGLARQVDAQSGPQLGFRTHQLLRRLGAGPARQALAALRDHLVEAFGARGEALADALAQELERAEDEARAHVRRAFEERVAELARRPRSIEAAPFATLSDDEIEDVRRGVRRLAERLRGGARVRARRERSRRAGRIDPHRTLRLALRTGGVPIRLARRMRRRGRPKLLLLCDVSDSVRAAATFLLEFTYCIQELFEHARTFVFVSELGETTDLFAREPVRAAIARAWGGALIGAGDNSNYGRVLRTFEASCLREVDRRTTVVILGDGRTNYHETASEVLDRIRERSRALLWLCTEPRGGWTHGDSAMAEYAPKCTAVHEVACAADLERAARALVAPG